VFRRAARRRYGLQSEVADVLVEALRAYLESKLDGGYVARNLERLMNRNEA